MRTIDKLLSFCDAHGMLQRGQRVLCAVSGGSDSVAMLHMLLQVAPQRSISIEVAHYNHCLRGAESDRDENFVRGLCAELEVAFHSRSGDVASRARELGRGIEETARLMRYEFLSGVAEHIGANVISTAHTADDNAETVLMHLARGSGARGLSGIPPVRGRIIRPMLCLSRNEVQDYLEEYGLDHVEDSTNDDPSYTRNRVRKELMPFFHAMNPSFSREVLSACELLREDDAFLDGLASDFLATQPEEGIDARALCALAAPVASRVIRIAAPDNASLSRQTIDRVLGFASAGRSGSAVQLNDDLEARLDQGKLYIGPKKLPGLIEKTQLKPGQTAIVPTRWKVSCTYKSCISDPCCTVCDFSVRGDLPELNIRSRQEKDALLLEYRGGRKTLKKLFIEAKIPVWRRGLVPVLASGDRAIAVPGFGVDEEFRAKAGQSAYIIKFSEE